MSEPNEPSTEPARVQNTAPPRRNSGRVTRGVFLTLAGIGLLAAGIHAIVDSSAVAAASSNTPRGLNTDTEAQIGGLILCMFGITVVGFGIALFTTKSEGSIFGKKPE